MTIQNSTIYLHQAQDMKDVLEGSSRRLLTHLSHPRGNPRVEERIQISKHDSLRKKLSCLR